MRLLIVEDDADAATEMQRGLNQAGHVAELAADGENGYRMAKDREYDILVIDRMLPRRDGLNVIEQLRREGNETQILVVSALTQVEDKVAGLNQGADDYLPKPYSFDELLARVEALGRRIKGDDGDNTYQVCDLILDRLTRSVTRAHRKISLQPREFKLLEYLMKHAGQVVTRAMLLEHVWNYHFDLQTNVIDVHISRLRNKIDKGFEKQLLQTIRGTGYTLRDDI